MPGYFSALPVSPRNPVFFYFHLQLQFQICLPPRLVPALLQSSHLHDFLYGNRASLHNPSYKYGRLIRSGHIPDYSSPYNSYSGRLHLLFHCTTHYYCSSHKVEEPLHRHCYGQDPTEYQFRYGYSNVMADTVSIHQPYQFRS